MNKNDFSKVIKDYEVLKGYVNMLEDFIVKTGKDNDRLRERIAELEEENRSLIVDNHELYDELALYYDTDSIVTRRYEDDDIRDRVEEYGDLLLQVREKEFLDSKKREGVVII